VSIGPGWMLLTVMPRLPTSLDNPLREHLDRSLRGRSRGTRPGHHDTLAHGRADHDGSDRRSSCASGACLRRDEGAAGTLMSNQAVQPPPSVVSSNVLGMAVPAIVHKDVEPARMSPRSFRPGGLRRRRHQWASALNCDRLFGQPRSISLTTTDAAASAPFVYVMATFRSVRSQTLGRLQHQCRARPPVTSAIFPFQCLGHCFFSYPLNRFSPIPLISLFARSSPRNQIAVRPPSTGRTIAPVT